MNNQTEIVSFLEAQNISCAYDPSMSFNDSVLRLKQFASWFRDHFPYYLDKCENCGNAGSNNYSGVVMPSVDELKYLARVVETYVCSKCSHMTKFPRYNNVDKVLDTRRGRCGEYSALMVRIMAALGYKARWVTDIADHLWVEVLLDNRWTHFDPCEAAINEPLIYQGWGKNQTYIIAYDIESRNATDVTHVYTSNLEGIAQRRQMDGINDSYIAQILQEASKNLSEVLINV
jgi:peptide-N4-(N-acetyl-beta-glucosaminyl)asparagine amidase